MKKKEKIKKIIYGIIGFIVLASLIYYLTWPLIQKMLVQQTCNTYGPNYKASKAGKFNAIVQNGTSNSQTGGGFKWACCPIVNGQAVADGWSTLPRGCIIAQ